MQTHHIIVPSDNRRCLLRERTQMVTMVKLYMRDKGASTKNVRDAYANLIPQERDTGMLRDSIRCKKPFREAVRHAFVINRRKLTRVFANELLCNKSLYEARLSKGCKKNESKRLVSSFPHFLNRGPRLIR